MQLFFLFRGLNFEVTSKSKEYSYVMIDTQKHNPVRHFLTVLSNFLTFN